MTQGVIAFTTKKAKPNNALFVKLGYLNGRIAADILSICLLLVMVFYSLCRFSLNDYIQSTEMAQESVWGSDIEIFAASCLLSTDIYVYSNVGSNFTWNKFSKSMLDGSPPQNTCSIYIQHPNNALFVK